MTSAASGGSLTGKWALVTGAAKRIGARICERLHAAGCGVAIHYRGSSDDAEALSARLNAERSDSAITVQADLLDSASLDPMVSKLIEQTGRLDILVNNASSFYPTPIGSITEEQWTDLMGTNLKAPLFLSQAAAPHLESARGCIVNIVDVHATRPLRNHTIYGPAKAGLAMLTRSLAKDLAPEIRVNGVSPGAVLWPEEGLSDKIKDVILKQVPLARPGDPDDIASCVYFLVAEAPYITGQIIAVDGGRSIGW